MLEEALSLHREGKLGEAAALYREILAQYPNNADALHLLGVIEFQRENPSAAIALIDRAIEIEPNNPLLWIEMGRLRMDQQNYPQAESMGRKALSMSVGDPHTQSSAWLLISDSLKARGRNPQAQDALAKSKELSEL